MAPRPRRLAQVDGNGRRNYSTVWSVYSVCSVLSLTGYGVRNAGLVLLAVVCNAVVLMLVMCAALSSARFLLLPSARTQPANPVHPTSIHRYDCPAETDVLSLSGVGDIMTSSPTLSAC